jgi:DNA polymerase III delta subunit
MLYFFTGTDTEKAREKLSAAVASVAKKKQIIRVTDAHSVADLDAALGGAGMFGLPGQGVERVVVLDGVLSNDELHERLLGRLKDISKSDDIYFMLETGIDAETRKSVEKYAETTERYDAPKKERDNSIFALANSLQRGKRKELWVGYQRELQKGTAPEAIHGTLFWAAKQQFLSHDSPKARALVAELAALPHEARRKGFDLEYALEHFVLARV